MTLQELQEQKDALDLQIAQTIRKAKIEQEALDLKFKEQRLKEIGPAIARIKELMEEYDIPKNAIFEDVDTAPVVKETWFTRICNVFRKRSSNSGKSATLSEMRKSSSEIWGE